MRNLLSLICCFLGCSCCLAQLESEMDVIPYRPRIAEFTVTSLYDYNANCNSDAFGNNASEIELDQKIKARLGIPIVMKQGTLIGLQLKYDNHDFIIEHHDPRQYELFNYIKEERFRSVGARFLISKDLDEKRNLTILAGTEIKSDKLVFNGNTTKSFINFNYKVQKNDHVSIGGGIALAYTLGNPQIYPIFYYENNFAKRWTLDLALPKSVVLRRQLSPKCYLSFKTEVVGWRYAVHNHELSQNVDEALTLRKSDLNMGFNFEHEIHDWLWLGVDAGYSHNLRSFLARPGDNRRDALIEMNATGAPYTMFSVFIVPPKKIYR